MLDRLLFHGLLVTALAPALMFAGRPLWAIVAAALAAGVLLLAASSLRAFRKPQGWTWTDGLLIAAGGIWAGVLAYAASQISTDGPAAAATLWREAAGLLGEPVPVRGSLNPGATGIGVLRLGLYAGVLVLAYWLCGSRARAWTVVTAVLAVVAVAALYAAALKVAGIEYVLWEKKRYYIGWATGPFANRSTFASYLAIGLACNVALWARAYRRFVPSEIEGRERLRLALESITRRSVFLALPGFAIAGAGLMTGSRAGTAAMAIAVVLTAGLIALRWRRDALLAPIVAVLSVTAVAGLLWVVAGDGVASRFDNLEDAYDVRQSLYEDAGRILDAHGARGVGLGAFSEALHAYKSADTGYDRWQAHNTYLENLIELGWTAGLAMFLAAGLVGFAAARAIWRRRRLAPVAAAATGGFIAVALHSAVHFPLQEPGVALTLALLLGAAAAQADGGD